MKVILLEESPPKGSTRPFEGNDGAHLREITGANFERLHLYSLMKNRAHRFLSLPYNLPQAEACRLMAVMPDDVVLLLAGHRSAKAFGVAARFFEPCMLNSTKTVTYVVPHPNAGNHWYGNEFNQFRARNFFDALFMVLDGVERPDGDMDATEFRVRARTDAVESGRVF